eukprot:TRINITY_DN7135_c3_g1_i1.p1 TRINITY_DN7135_c3_g1~~TRINITY_DN7135_c3_g1_i1.p1  ORF type:complete len:1013 (-),score=168.57 TRINITY_DN7135_c3_g1_i1:348-3386(-)
MAQATAKAKLRTSEDVFKRLRFEVDLNEDSDFFGNRDVWMGYEDGIFGPMEQNLADFVPVNDGGDLPFHSLWYVRCGDRILWDRRRRLDELWKSGDTPSIHRTVLGEKVKGFDIEADRKAAEETRLAISRAAATQIAMQEERQHKLDEQQRKRERQLQKRQREKEDRERRALAERPKSDAEPVSLKVVGGAAGRNSMHAELRVLTWNVLNDAHADDYPAEAQSCHRAAGLAQVVSENEPDVFVMQEATASMIAAVDNVWPKGCWRTDALGELVVWSRYPISRALGIKLGSDSNKEALLVEVTVQRRSVAFAAVHFTSDFHGDNAVKRAVQARMVRAAHADLMPYADIFVCGDFNEPNAEGGESAAICMNDLEDAWLVVHDQDRPGFTFDPSRNRLADIVAICKTPRRLDRIYAVAAWSAKSAILLGDGTEHSDHYGLLATFGRESSLTGSPVHTSAVVLIPPESLWDQIDAIRKRFDKSYGWWMPHINLIYGFLPESHFPEVALVMETVARRHGPLELRLEELTLFEHANSASLVVVPSCNPDADGVRELQQALQTHFPSCVEQSSREAGFQAHLTLAKFEGDSWREDARHWKAVLEESWHPVSFVASEVFMIARSDDQPFSIRSRLPLGSSLSHGDSALLERIEACSGGARAFPIGSAALLGSLRAVSSDFDVLLVGTCDQETAFQNLETRTDAKWARRASGKFPLLQLEVDGTKLDIQYAQSNRVEHPTLWPNAESEEGGLAAAALRDVCALRASVLVACGMNGWQLFQRALIRLKRWTKKRCIDSNALGYLGGFAWSLLLADTLLNEFEVVSTEQDPRDTLVLATCKRFAAWAWPLPVLVGHPQADAVLQNEHIMPILCPTMPHANCARNVTESTRAVLQMELNRKAHGQEVPLLQDYHSFIRCQILVNDPAQAAPAAHWLEARLLALVRKLDHVGGRPLRLCLGLYVVGATADLATLKHLVNDFHEMLLRDDRDGHGWREMIEICVDDRESFVRVQEAHRKNNKGYVA